MTRRTRPVPERFWEKVDKSGGPDACWLWLAGSFRKGYGAFYLEGRLRKAHRVAYELLVGPIPEGLHIDHLCRVTSCVNPAHLEPVTPAENIRRSPFTLVNVNGSKTHCHNGHEFNVANTYVSATGHRKCRTCLRLQRRESRRMQRQL